MALPQALRVLRPVRPAETGGTPPLSSERAALAEAIAYLAELRAQTVATDAAIDTAKSKLWAAMEAMDAAPEMVERAKANAAIFLQQQARNLAPVPPQTIREARNLVCDAQDDLDVAQAARTALEAEYETLQSRLPGAEDAVRRAARVVLQAEAEGTARALAAELHEMQVAIYRLGCVVEWLASAGAFAVVDRIGGSYGRPADNMVRMVIDRVHSPAQTWNGLAQTRPEAVAGWAAALTALQADATAPLPGVPGA